MLLFAEAPDRSVVAAVTTIVFSLWDSIEAHGKKRNNEQTNKQTKNNWPSDLIVQDANVYMCLIRTRPPCGIASHHALHIVGRGMEAWSLL